MTIWRLAAKELLHRQSNFILSLLAVSVAVGCLVGALSLLRAHDQRTQMIIAAKEAETHKRMEKLEDDYRKIMKNLGFNVMILPKDQNLGDLYADDYALKTMPEEYASRLAKSRIVTINHLLPSLQQKIKWPEQQRTIILIGTRGEVPVLFANPTKPILDPVAAGEIVLGHELFRSLNAKDGDKIKLLGKSFIIRKHYSERGTKDDITAWINLREAQTLLRKEGLINGILALECVCAADSLAQIRAEICQILPDTQVIEFHTQTIARAEARRRAAEEARQSVESEKQIRARLRQEREGFAAILVPLSVVGCALWIGFLTLANVRARQHEIGILRAIGFRSSQILSLFLTKAVLIGLFGACLGSVGGMLASASLGEASGISGLLASLAEPAGAGIILVALVTAPILSALASWIPATLAAQQDPAQILREG